MKTRVIISISLMTLIFCFLLGIVFGTIRWGNMWRIDKNGEVEKVGRVAVTSPWQKEYKYFNLDNMNQSSSIECYTHIGTGKLRFSLTLRGSLVLEEDEKKIAQFAKEYITGRVGDTFYACEAIDISLEKAFLTFSSDEFVLAGQNKAEGKNWGKD